MNAAWSTQVGRKECAQPCCPLHNIENLFTSIYMQAHAESTRAVRFSPEGRLLVTASADQSILAVDVATGKPAARKAAAHPTGVDRLMFVSDTTLASGELAWRVRIRRGSSDMALILAASLVGGEATVINWRTTSQ